VFVYKAMYKFLDEGGVHAEVLDFPGAITCADTLPEARRMLASALEDMAETLILQGQPIPLPDASRTSPEGEAGMEEPIYLLIQGAARVRITPVEVEG
jgi:predicted RNase H-like HicB family nuclease